MIIHSPIFSGSINQAATSYANLSGSFSGSFTGSFKGDGSLLGGVTANSITYENVTGKPTLVSGSSQVSYPQLSNIPSGIISSSAQIDTLFNIDGIVSGSSQITYSGISSIPAGIVSGSSQVSYPDLSNISAGIVSGSSQVTPLLPTGVVSGSSQVTPLLPTGVVSGSSQVSYPDLSNIPVGIVSGSTQVTPLLPTGTVSGSSQITYTSISSIPAGIVSGSSQLSGTTITDLTIVNLTTVNETASVIFSSGSNRFGDFGNDTHSFTGSVQVSGSFTLIGPSTATSYNGTINATNGVVSGSSQIDVASTTGDIILGTRTSGNYVASLVAGTNITLSNNSGEGATPTIGLTNNTISGISLGSNLATLTIGTGLSGTSYNGSGAVTIANTGVTSNVAGTGVTVSGATGAVTISIGQAVATNSEVQFAKVGVGGVHDATYELKVTGDIGATGDIVAYVSSDERLKNNVEVISNPIEKVQSLRGVTWEWNELASDAAKQSPNVGVIAQEVEKVLPQLVHDRENGFKGVDYAKLTGLLIEAIKEQQKQIDELKSRL